MIYVILGCTASGKTDLAIKIARKYSLPLIGADAYQVYKEFQIGTATPTEQELSGITTHLIKDHSIKEPLSVADYQKEVRSLLGYYQSLGKDVVLVGGTFLYVKAALFDYSFPKEDFTKTQQQEESLQQMTNKELQLELKQRNPLLADTIHVNNRKRIVRALLKPDSEASDCFHLLYPAVFFAIDRSVEEIDSRIKARSKKMMDDGLVDEVKNLAKDERNLTSAFQAIGYKETLVELEKEGEIDLESLTRLLATKTRQYAKRQRTFLRHQFPNLFTNSFDEILKEVEFKINKKSRTVAALGQTYSQIEKAKPLVVGLGGVGSILTLTLASLGVFSISVLDFDEVDASNLNRQIAYDKENIGELKTTAIKRKINAIDPYVDVIEYPFKLDVSSIEKIDPTKISFIFDCIDDVEAKVLLYQYAFANKIPLIVSCGTARRFDSTKIRLGTLKDTGEPLAKAMKKKLKLLGIDPENIPAVYSIENPQDVDNEVLQSLPSTPNAAGLALVSYFIKQIAIESVEKNELTKNN